jgi:hypothetical protein
MSAPLDFVMLALAMLHWRDDADVSCDSFELHSRLCDTAPSYFTGRRAVYNATELLTP